MSENNTQREQSTEFISLKCGLVPTVHAVLNGEKFVTINGIYTLAEKLTVGKIVFLTLGGDIGKREVDWDPGFRGIAHVVKEPYDYGYDGRPKYFKFDIVIDILLPNPMKREHFLNYEDAFDAAYIGPELARDPSQAVSTLEFDKAVAVVRAALDMYPQIKENIINTFEQKFQDKVFAPIKMLLPQMVGYGELKSIKQQKDDDVNKMFTPEWFKAKAKDYPTFDAEAKQLLVDFQKKFAPDILASLSGIELLNTVFLNPTNPENLCRILEFDSQIKDTFGSIKGGTSHKYGLYYSAQGVWTTGSARKSYELIEEEAIELGEKLRDHLVAGAKAIEEYGALLTIDDYKKLHKILDDVTEGDIARVWFMKYYQMLYPEYFATNYSDYAQRTVLGVIGQEKEKYPLVRMGQIRFYANKCGISNVMFNKIFWQYYTEDTGETKDESLQDICYRTGYQSDFSRNRILFGAPGTGKSFTLNKEKDILLADGGKYERVTFHPDYSYANFVGTYKPVPCKDSEGKDAITYKYVPGPFMRIYVEALKNSRTDNPKPFLLVIEEINRANVAAVFGDVFQLLDRGDDEVSEYPIQASEDIKKYLADELGGKAEDYNSVCIPDNMFIWATMNSADQGVFPMDTAFKRRWDFTYLGIDDSENGIVGKKVVLGQGEYCRVVEWNKLRKAINDELLTYKVNEDKLLGPYFIAKKNLPEDDVIDTVTFTRIFKNKVIMYLFDDAAKQKRATLFSGCDEKTKNQYSKICREFDQKGVYIFCDAISNQFIDEVTEGNAE